MSSTDAPPRTRSAMRWRSESRTLRGSVDASRRSRSRSVNPFGRLTASRSRSQAPHASKSTQNGNQQGANASSPGAGAKGGDLEKGKEASPPPKPWYRISPFLPILKHIPLWLEGYIWGLIGGFVGVGCVIIIFTRAMAFSDSADVQHGPWTAPAVVGSFGASAVLLYSVPASPLSQPRTVFFGQAFSSVIGVCITKLFALNSGFNLNYTDHSWSLVWIAGALATGLAILVMQLTRTIHPPGGATAVLAATSPPVTSLGWHYIPVVMLSAAVMVVWAWIWMNLGRKSYPEWWFFPPEKVRKTAFPGPELGGYYKKAKKGLFPPKGKPTEEVLPTSSDDGSAQTQQAQNGGAAHSEWKDQGNWKAEEKAAPPIENLQNVDEREEQQQQQQPATNTDEERQSRWDRPER